MLECVVLNLEPKNPKPSTQNPRAFTLNPSSSREEWSYSLPVIQYRLEQADGDLSPQVGKGGAR